MDWWTRFRAWKRRNGVTISPWRTTDAEMESDFDKFKGGDGQQSSDAVDKKGGGKQFFGVKIGWRW
jgi:hypothetical protein